jgi:CubicO group peptidase (beta-lactamase class C family)
VLIEAITGQDFRDVIRELVISPLGLDSELFVGVPEAVLPRCAAMFEPVEHGRAGHALARHGDDTDARKRAGVPGGGGYGSARAMAAFYQALLAGGTLNGNRILGPRTLDFVLQDWTGERIAEQCGFPMHFALGPYKRGTTLPASDLGTLAGPRTYGHGGVGSSVCWADPDTGVSFAYVSNCRAADPWHSLRMDTLSYLVQAAVL